MDFLEENVQGFLLPEAPEEQFAEKLSQAQAAGLPVEAANCFLPGALKCTGPAMDLDRILRYAATAFERAGQAGIRSIVFGSGGSRQIPEGFPVERAREQFIALLKRLGPLAQPKGVTIVVEPLNRAECNFINSVPEAAAIVQEANHPHVRLLADIYHMTRDRQSPEDLRAPGPLLRHLHIAEDERRTPPGTAGDDFRGYLRVLREVGYDGRLSIECGWQDLKSQAAPGIAELRRQLTDAGYAA